MTSAQRVLRSTAFLAAALLAACGTNRPAPASPVVARTSSVAQADERLAAVAVERTAIEALYAEREAVCYDKFFVNSCLDAAKESRRSALAVQRAIEVEAERFKRQHKVEERDRAIAEVDAVYQAEEARAAAQPAVPAKKIAPVPPARPSSVAARKARHEARMAEEAAQEPARAAERAASVAAYEERKRKSEARQRQVAQRKAEREAKRAADRAAKEAAKKAEKEAAAPAR